MVPIFLFLAVFVLYTSTAAPGTLFGDPSEYQFIPAILGIAHPPGYAFYTLLAKAWQTLVPVGTVAFRTNLLAAAVGAWTVTAVYLIVRDLGEGVQQARLGRANGTVAGVDEHTPARLTDPSITLSAVFAACCLAAAPDFWQHAIHSNAHIVSAALALTHTWLLVRWWRTGRVFWLGLFALALGWAATHHPITLMGVPAYGLFVLVARPQILRRWRALLLLVGCLVLGLMPLLYYPLRSPSAPFGPTDMRTWEGFSGHITARDLRVNLFHFGVSDQADRALVFWTLLRLQFPLLVLGLIVVGLLWLVLRGPKPALLLVAFILSHLLFTLNTVQDVMAYLLIPFAGLSIAAGVGALALSVSLVHRLAAYRVTTVNGLLAVCLMVWPLLQVTVNLARGISLHDFLAAEEFVAATYDRFAGRGEGGVLVSDWEHLTPLWVHMHTQAEPLEERDLTLVYVSTAMPWVESVWANIEAGPIYLPDYRPVVRDAGFRLVPDSAFYQVVPPPVTAVVPTVPLDVWADGRIHILGYDLSAENVRAGEYLELTLYQSVPEVLEGIWMPYAQLGPVEARWTTDSRLLTPQWLPDEVVVERYEVRVPFGMQPGSYPLRLGYADLSSGRAALELSNGEPVVDLASITVLPNPKAPPPGVLERTLANLDNQIALVRARGRAGWQVQSGLWNDPLVVHPGGVLHLTLTWRALTSPRESYTIFIHLIDGAGRPVTGHDYTPLGGACPTFLWFPKWLPGQTFADPYRLVIPDSLSPGDYWLEVGMYGMTSLRRLPVVDLSGSLAGDRVILGSVRVE